MPNAFDLFALSMATTRMMAEAQMVMTLRMMGMAGVIPSPPGENSRMVSEKMHAVQASGLAMTKAAMAGANATAIVTAGLKPVGRKTRANVRRLMKPHV